MKEGRSEQDLDLLFFLPLPSTVEWAWRLLHLFFPLGMVGKGNRGGRVGFSGFVGGGEEKTGWGVGDGKVERVSISVFVTIRKEGKDEMRRK